MIKNEAIYRENMDNLLDEIKWDMLDVTSALRKLNKSLFRNDSDNTIRIDADFLDEMLIGAIDHLQQMKDNINEIRNEIVKAK